MFNTYALKRCVRFSLHHFPTLQYFFHKKLLPAIVISLHVEEEKQPMYRFKSLKEKKYKIKKLSLCVNGWGRKA